MIKIATHQILLSGWHTGDQHPVLLQTSFLSDQDGFSTTLAQLQRSSSRICCSLDESIMAGEDRRGFSVRV